LANPYDLSLRGLGRPQSQSLKDPAVQRYQKLANELVFAMAPRPLAPAETLGMSGFEFSLVSTLSDISEGEDYWQGQPGNPIFEGVLSSHSSHKIPSRFWVPTAHLRKGLPMSTEIGISGTYLAYSEMFMLGGEFKGALHESYFRWAPAVSFRVAFGRLFGASDLDIMSGEWDVLASMPFGLGGMVQLTPYLGYGMLYAQVNSQVIDETPYEVMDATDQKGGTDGSLYTFPTIEWQDNSYGRFFGGFRVNVAMMELIYEINLGFADTTLQSHSIKLGFDV
ncbi:MAG: hypothetical protein HYZ27_03065, partial [Deltaproteobacteria bacterium]|nr:hypothetical protein [Deltaproteobacteria bacterium]